MLEFAIQVYLIKMKSETSPISLITKLRQLPTSSLVGDYRNIEIRVLFFNNLERLLWIANQDDMAERIWFSSRAHYSRVKNGNTWISRKFEERLVDILEDLIHKD
jgi:hypothetical protein